MKHLHDIPEAKPLAKTWFDQMFVSTAPQAYREVIREMTYRVPANAQWLTVTTAGGFGGGGTTTIRRG